MVDKAKTIGAKRFDVYLVNLDPTVGSEINKKRPCVIISSDDVNQYLNTVTIACMTSTIKRYPTRVDIDFEKKEGQVALDQIRTIDKVRLLKRLGSLDAKKGKELCRILQSMFAY